MLANSLACISLNTSFPFLKATEDHLEDSRRRAYLVEDGVSKDMTRRKPQLACNRIYYHPKASRNKKHSFPFALQRLHQLWNTCRNYTLLGIASLCSKLVKTDSQKVTQRKGRCCKSFHQLEDLPSES